MNPLRRLRSDPATNFTGDDMDPLRIVVAGAAGRMGQSIVRSVVTDPECTLVGALERARHDRLGFDAGMAGAGDAVGVIITADASDVLRKAEALIDFTIPPVSVDLVQKAAELRIVHVIGTTGFNREQEDRIQVASRSAVIVKSGNMSLGANLLVALVRQTAKALQGFDVQVLEMHHRMKKDAPSGTALMLGQAAAAARGLPAPQPGDEFDPAGQEGAGIGFASLRGGTVVGDHKVIFAGPHERVVLEHLAEDRAIFARGAIAAAKWGRLQSPGRYSMMDVLGL
jgi:4-hydroxy-tetrahydrodipicolinate reductase